MAEWVIRSQQQFEDEWVAKLGREEFDRRNKVAKQKADKIDNGTTRGFNESCILSGIFLSMALAMSQETFDKAANVSHTKWRALAYKVAT